MRAHEILDEKFGDVLGAAAYLSSLGYAGAQSAAEIKSHFAPTHQVQSDADADDEFDGVTYALSDASPLKHHGEADHKSAHMTVSREQATLLALTMWGEGRGHGIEGMRAVGHVILNRIKSNRNFGDSVKDVVFKRKAFSCWNPSDPNREAMREISRLPKNSPDYFAFKQAKKLAVKLLQGQLRDTTNGAVFYHTDAINPSWADGIKPVSKFADHLFYRTDRKAEPKQG